MSEQLPEMRANWTRMMLDFYERHLPDSARAVVNASLDAASRARLMEAGPLEWLNAEIHMRILPAPFAVMGKEAYRELWQQMMRDSLDRPLFRPLIQGAVAMFQKTPGHIYRVVPQGFGLIARGCGEFEVNVNPTRKVAIVSWKDIPILFRRDDAFAFAWWGTMESILSVAQATGTVTTAYADHLSRINYTIKW